MSLHEQLELCSVYSSEFRFRTRGRMDSVVAIARMYFVFHEIMCIEYRIGDRGLKPYLLFIVILYFLRLEKGKGEAERRGGYLGVKRALEQRQRFPRPSSRRVCC